MWRDLSHDILNICINYLPLEYWKQIMYNDNIEMAKTLLKENNKFSFKLCNENDLLFLKILNF